MGNRTNTRTALSEPKRGKRFTGCTCDKPIHYTISILFHFVKITSHSGQKSNQAVYTLSEIDIIPFSSKLAFPLSSIGCSTPADSYGLVRIEYLFGMLAILRVEQLNWVGRVHQLQVSTFFVDISGTLPTSCRSRRPWIELKTSVTTPHLLSFNSTISNLSWPLV